MATGGENSVTSTAPDVTYDATLLDDQTHTSLSQRGEKEETEPSKERSVRFKEEVESQRSPAGGEEKKSREEEEEWMDILGSGDLKKKVKNTSPLNLSF